MKTLTTILLFFISLGCYSQSRFLVTLYFDQEVIIKCDEFPSYIDDTITLQFPADSLSPYTIITENVYNQNKDIYIVSPDTSKKRLYYIAYDGRLIKSKRKYCR